MTYRSDADAARARLAVVEDAIAQRRAELQAADNEFQILKELLALEKGGRSEGWPPDVLMGLMLGGGGAVLVLVVGLIEYAITGPR